MDKFERIIIYPLLIVALFYSFTLYYNLKDVNEKVEMINNNIGKMENSITTERLIINDKNDNVLMGLGANSEGHPTFLITSAKGKRAVGIRGNKGYGSITLFNDKEDIVMELNGEKGGNINLRKGEINLFNSNNKLVTHLGTGIKNNSTLRLYNNKENIIVGIGADMGGSGTIRTYNNEGIQNTGLGSAEEDFGALRIFDNKEKILIGLDATNYGGYMYINNPGNNSSNYYTINGMTGEINN